MTITNNLTATSNQHYPPGVFVREVKPRWFLGFFGYVPYSRNEYHIIDRHTIDGSTKKRSRYKIIYAIFREAVEVWNVDRRTHMLARVFENVRTKDNNFCNAKVSFSIRVKDPDIVVRDYGKQDIFNIISMMADKKIRQTFGDTVIGHGSTDIIALQERIKTEIKNDEIFVNAFSLEDIVLVIEMSGEETQVRIQLERAMTELERQRLAFQKEKDEYERTRRLEEGKTQASINTELQRLQDEIKKKEREFEREMTELRQKHERELEQIRKEPAMMEALAKISLLHHDGRMMLVNTIVSALPQTGGSTSDLLKTIEYLLGPIQTLSPEQRKAYEEHLLPSLLQQAQLNTNNLAGTTKALRNGEATIICSNCGREMNQSAKRCTGCSYPMPGATI